MLELALVPAEKLLDLRERQEHVEDHVGPLAVDPPVVLAPMAGITNRAYRQLCREASHELYPAGAAALYVCEMRTYMMDADGTGQNEPKSRVSKLVDKDGDGYYETVTVFIDNLVLPRMVLPLADRVVIAAHLLGVEAGEERGAAGPAAGRVVELGEA